MKQSQITLMAKMIELCESFGRVTQSEMGSVSLFISFIVHEKDQPPFYCYLKINNPPSNELGKFYFYFDILDRDSQNFARNFRMYPKDSLRCIGIKKFIPNNKIYQDKEIPNVIDVFFPRKVFESLNTVSDWETTVRSLIQTAIKKYKEHDGRLTSEQTTNC